MWWNKSSFNKTYIKSSIGNLLYFCDVPEVKGLHPLCVRHSKPVGSSAYSNRLCTVWAYILEVVIAGKEPIRIYDKGVEVEDSREGDTYSHRPRWVILQEGISFWAASQVNSFTSLSQILIGPYPTLQCSVVQRCRQLCHLSIAWRMMLTGTLLLKGAKILIEIKSRSTTSARLSTNDHWLQTHRQTWERWLMGGRTDGRMLPSTLSPCFAKLRSQK